MNVIIACDKNYIQHASVMTYSLFKNNKGIKINLFILTEKTHLESFSPLIAICDQFKVIYEFKYVDSKLIENFSISKHISLATYYRLLIPELFPHLSKALYLDCDMIIHGNLEELYKIDISDYIVAAVSAPNFNQFELFEITSKKYFNAGVLLINLEKWRSEIIVSEMIQYTNNKSSILINWDQDVLNHFFQNRWLEIPHIWNHQSIFFRNQFIGKYDLKPIIIHFSSSMKPWQYGDTHPYRKLYFQYLSETSFENFKPRKPPLLNQIKYSFLKLIKYDHYRNPYILILKRRIFKRFGIRDI